MLGQAETIGNGVKAVMLIPEPAVVQAEGLMEIGQDQSRVDFLGALAGRNKLQIKGSLRCFNPPWTQNIIFVKREARGLQAVNFSVHPYRAAQS